MNEIERILTYHRNDCGKVAGAGEQRKRVLVVEGDGFTRITLMNWLLAAGFEVDFAPNGRLGLHQLRMWEPDTVIMELNLRDLPGLEFIHRARQEGRFQGRPIYVFTSTHFVKRATERELAAMGVKVFDKLSIAPETLVVKVARELNGQGPVESGEWTRRAGADGRRQMADGRPGKGGSREVEEVPDNLSESMSEIWLQAKSLARCAGPMQRVAACAELREEVYALLSHAAVGGHRSTARQAKALVDFLDHLCEQSQQVNDAAMETVAQSVEVLSDLTNETTEKRQEAAKFKVVVVAETAGSCESIQEALHGAGLEPVGFADPALALEHLAAEPADLIITNLSAAGQETLDLASIRALQLHQDTPVIAAPEVAPESGDGSLAVGVPVADPECAAHPGLLMQALNILQKPAADDLSEEYMVQSPERGKGGGREQGGPGGRPPCGEVTQNAELQKAELQFDFPQDRPLTSLLSQPEASPESETSFADHGQDGETSNWKRKDNCRRDAPAEMARIREACAAYLIVAGSQKDSEPLTSLYRQVRFFGARARHSGFSKLAEVGGALEALLFELIFHRVQPEQSVLHMLVEAVDCLGGLVETGDMAFPEPIVRPRILVVDGDGAWTMTTVAALNLAQFDAIGNQDPIESLRLLESGNFDIVMLDAQMPGWDGFQMCEHVRGMPQYRSRPIILFSASGDADSHDRSVILGASDFVVKPVTPVEVTLMATLHWARATARENAESRTENTEWRTQNAELGTGETGRGGGPDEQILAAGDSTASTTTAGEGLQNQGAVSYDDTSRKGDVPLKYEVELAELRQTNQELNAKIAEEQQRVIELAKRAQELEQHLKERSVELEHARAALQKQGNERTQAEAALRQQLAEAGALQQQAQERCRQVEGELADLRVLGDEHQALSRELEQQLKERSAELQKQGNERARTEAELRQQLEETEAVQKQTQARCSQLETESADLREVTEDLIAKVAGEKQRADESERRSKGLEKQLMDRSVQLERARVELEKQGNERAQAEAELRQRLAEAGARQQQAQERCRQMEGELADLQVRADSHQGRSRELEQQIKERSAELERARAEGEKQNDEHANAELQLRQQLAEAEAGQNQARERCTHLERELANLQVLADGHEARSRELEERSKELGTQLASREQQLRLNEQKYARVLSDLEREGARRQLTEEESRRAHELNGRYEKNIASLEEANKVLLSSREELQSLLESNLGKLHETETRLERENSGLSEELRVARRTAAIESEQRRIEFSQQQAALQREQVERNRLETINVRLRHAAINAKRNGQWGRQNMEHQTRQAVEDLLGPVERLLALENRPEQAALAGELREKLMGLKARFDKSASVNPEPSTINPDGGPQGPISQLA